MTEEHIWNPKEHEDRIWNIWQSHGVFEADVSDNTRPTYVILMPPPNVTSRLHMGHGTGYTIQDFLIRWKRMQGFNVCWLPGTDHAGIATQMMVEKEIMSEGLSKEQMGRDAFVKRVEVWKDKYGGIILDQFRQMGFSCDWSRLAYSMDPQLSEAVKYVFVSFFKEGLIYRGHRLVNWDCALQTALSDDELENIEVEGFLFEYRYPLENGQGSLLVATTRPETLFGDQAIAVHPDDERYRHLIGQRVKCPLEDRYIPIIGDTAVKIDFGTGALKVTPSHDLLDFEIGLRHQLAHRSILDEKGSLTGDIPDVFKGLDRFEARKQVVKALKEKGLFESQKSHKHLVPHSSRSKTVIEYRLSWQWFIKMKDLAEPALDASRKGQIRFYPATWQKTWDHWLVNIQDWCISRQLWWGHRIPVWTCQSCGYVDAYMEEPSACPSCGHTHLEQDPDVLDTWFSSWLWPLSPFGWPQNTPDLQKFFPSDVLVTGADIIFLWVARMAMVSLKFMNQVPFKDIYFNATVCDQQGRKFSKTLGNGIDPQDIREKYGADALRYTALQIAPLGGRLKMKVSDFDRGARFVNKIWNAYRFIKSVVGDSTSIAPLNEEVLSLGQKWILTELHHVTRALESLLPQYRINEGVNVIYHYFWGSFCDWFLEISKIDLRSDDPQIIEMTRSVLIYAFEGAIRLLHPIVPFVTEAIWSQLPAHPNWPRQKVLALSAYPQSESILSDSEAHEHIDLLIQIVSQIRSLRQQSGLAPDTILQAHIEVPAYMVNSLHKAGHILERLARLDRWEIAECIMPPAHSLITVGPRFKIFVPVAHLVNLDDEKERMKKEMVRLHRIIEGMKAKLSNSEFVDKAPADVVKQTRHSLSLLVQQYESLASSLESLSR